MKLRQELTNTGKRRYIIRVSAHASNLPGVLLERDYILVKGESTEKGVAVFYKDDYNRNVILNQDIWPLISVWSAALDAKLQYIIRTSTADALRVSGEADTPEVLANGVCAKMGDNHWVVKVPYVPDAVSFVRMARDEEGRLTGQGIDVGVVTPYMKQSGPSAGRAIVSVVMGERYARAFYAWVGITQTARKVPVSKDKPLQVTKYQDSVDKQWEMSAYFISPGDDYEAGGVRTIFRRHEDKNRPKVRPLLDGAIYQPRCMFVPDMSPYLVTDLTWNGAYARPYYIAFTQQFCLHIMSYLYQTYRMNAIEWRYALPREMDAFNQKRMSDIWRKEMAQGDSRIPEQSLR